MKLLLVIVLVLIYSTNAQAYIDPGSGSAIMSAIIGFFVAIGLVIKTFWYKIKSFFTENSPDDSGQESED